jgi:hypothetical protein
MNTVKISPKDEKRLTVAKRDFLKLEREIKPFLRQRKIVVPTTAGQWQTGSPVPKTKTIETNSHQYVSST